MTRLGRATVFLVALALVAVGCMSSAQVNSTDARPTSTPLPTAKPVFIPTTAPPPPTPVPPPTAVVATDTSTDDGDAASDSSDGEDTSTTSESNDDDSNESQADDEDAPEPTATPSATEVPTSVPAPEATARPAPRPSPLPTRNACPNGQVLVGATCACPVGQAKRASDQQCVRLCVQSDLTISNNCVCTGELYDNGGQCVKRCQGGQVTDNFGGCKSP